MTYIPLNTPASYQNIGTNQTVSDIDRNNYQAALKVNPLLDAGYSYEDITAQTGVHGNWVRDYADRTRPGYGIGDGGGGGGGNVSGVSTSNSAAATPAYDPNDLAYIDGQIQRLQALLGRGGTIQAQGTEKINNSYNREKSRANTDRGVAIGRYDAQEKTATNSKDSSLRRSEQQARTLADTLRQRIGLASGSGSSAYQINAPNVVAQTAEADRTGVLESYGQNFTNLKNARDDAKTEFGRFIEDLGIDRREKQSALESGIQTNAQDTNTKLSNLASERQRLLGGSYQDSRLAQQPYEAAYNQANTNLDSIFNTYKNPTVTAAPVKVKNVALGEYELDPAKLGQGQLKKNVQDTFKPLDEEDEEGLF